MANLNEFSLSKGYNVVNYNGEAVYIEGVLRLLSIDEDSIRIEVLGSLVTITGESLSIYELSDCLIVKGSVRNMNFEPINNVGKRSKKRNEIKKSK